MLGEWQKQKNYQSNIMVEMQFRQHIKRSESKKREMLYFENLIGWNTKCFLSFAVKIHPVSKKTGKNCLHPHTPQYFVCQNNPWGWKCPAGEREGRGNAQKCPGLTFHSFCLRTPVVFFLSHYHQTFQLLPWEVAFLFSAVSQLFVEHKFLPNLQQFLMEYLASHLLTLSHVVLFL